MYRKAAKPNLTASDVTRAAPSEIHARSARSEHQPATHSVEDVGGALGQIGNGRVGGAANAILGAEHEPMVWQESPSLALMAGPALKYLVLSMIMAVGMLTYASRLETQHGARPSAEELAVLAAPVPAVVVPDKPGKSKTDSAAGKRTGEQQALSRQREAIATREAAWKGVRWLEWARNASLAYFAMQCLLLFARLKTTRYRMSSQRLIIDHGILNRTSWPIELHSLGSAVVRQPLLLRFFKVANLHVSGLTLQGLRNAELVRDLIRNAGQMEAQRMDKIRWR